MEQREIGKWTKILLICLNIILCCSINSISADAAISNNWEVDMCEENICKLAYGNGKFVGITYDGFGIVSEDGYEWIKGQNIGDMEKLIFCGKYFYAYGYDSSCYLSADGIVWEYISIGQEEKLDNICYYEGVYYAFTSMMVLGGAGYNRGWVTYLYTSDDGVQWKYQKMEKGITHTNSIIGKNMWLTFGKKDVDYYCNQVFLWNNYEWKELGQLTDIYNSLVDGVYGNGGFVVVDTVGNIYTSTNGQNWELENSKSKEPFYKIIYGKNHYIAYNGSGELFVKNVADSTNKVWKTMELGTNISDIAYGEGKLLVCSNDYGLMINEMGCSANAYLSNVEFMNGNLTETFQYNKYLYKLCIPQEVSQIKITPSIMEIGGSLLLGIDGVEQGISAEETLDINVKKDTENFYLKVIAENGVTYKKYFFDIQWQEKYCIQAQKVNGGTVYGGGYGAAGDVIELSASPLEGYVFGGWYEDDTFYSNQPTISIVVTGQSRVFTPVFQLKQSGDIYIFLEKNTVEPGETYELKLLDENGEECEGEFEILNQTYSYIYREQNENRYYLNVDYSDRSEALIIRATLGVNKEVQTTIQVPLVRVINTYTVSGINVPMNAGTICGTGTVEMGKSVRICAKENVGYKFHHWNHDGELYSEEKSFVLGNIQWDYMFEAIYEKLKLSSIEIVKKPDKLVYYEGEEFETNGMQVVASYEDGSKGEIVDYTVNKMKGLVLEDDKVIISYVEDEVERTAELVIQVLTRTDEGTNSGDENGKSEDQQPSNDEGGNDESQQPSDDEGESDEIQRPSRDEGENDESQQPSNDEEGNDESQQPSDDKGGNDEIQQPSDDEGGNDKDQQASGNECGNDKNQQSVGYGSGKYETKQPSTENSGSKTTYKLKQKIKKGDLTYQIIKLKNRTGSVSVIKGKKNLKSVSIPNEIQLNGYRFKVVQIGKKAFSNQIKLKKVTIGKNVKNIHSYAFGNCKKLRFITIKSTSLTKVDKKAFYGIHKKNKVKIPKKCKKKYAAWIKNNKLNTR